MNPETGDILGVLERFVENYRAAVWVFAVDSNSINIWNADSLFVTPVDDNANRPMAVIPISDREYLLILDGIATRYNGSSMMTSFPLPPQQDPYPYPGYARMLGSRFLRWHTLERHLYLETLDFAGQIVDASPFATLPASSSDYSIIQNPSDSGFAVVCGSADGIHMLLLDKHLNVLLPDTRISATSGRAINPSAAFRNDSLFIVWEDYRNGNPDIYGSALKVATSLGVEQPRASTATNRISGIIPNPASGSAVIELSGSGGTIEVIDSYGELRLRVPVRSARAVIDTRGLASGMYRIVLRGDRVWDSKALVVVR
jgi:hypothetical protein